VSIPKAIRDGIRQGLWTIADEIGWSTLGDTERSRYYELWTRDPRIGGELAHFMDPRKVRVYIKDSLLKSYGRERLLASENVIWGALGLPIPSQVAQTFIKPHGRRLHDGKVICWGKSRDWKLILMAVFDRGSSHAGATAFGAVLVETGPTSKKSKRLLVTNASRRLGIQHIAWLDG
jgi:hypothetical protein